jgi:chromosome segregation ATPase
MLVAMVIPCLSTPKSERHAIQTLGVTQIEELMNEDREKLVQSIDQAQKQFAELEGSRDSLSSRLTEAEGNFASKKTSEQTKQSALDEATKAVVVAEHTLAVAKEAERKGEEPLANMRAEKATFDTLLKEHFNAPMQANEGPHYGALEPHIGKLGLDESLAIALPSSCTKNKEQRGGFDDVVLGELEKALTSKIESIDKEIAGEIPQIAERKAAVVAAESVLEEKVAIEKGVVTDLEAAKTLREESAAELSKAKDDLSTLAPTIRQVAHKSDELKLQLSEFETGSLATFQSLRDKEVQAATIDDEVASAGA